MRNFICKNVANIMICNLTLWLISVPIAAVLYMLGMFSYETFCAIAVALVFTLGFSAIVCAICS